MIRLTVPEIHPSDIEAVREVLQSGFLVQGPKVAAFEEALGRYLGVEGAVAVGSGTAALHLALLAAGIGGGDEVLVPDFTFPATANAVIHTGAVPVLVDVERESFNMDPEAARACLSPRTRAILPVHAFGRPANLAALGQLAEEKGLVLLEDAACALGSRFGERACGTVGRAGCFSFHPRKSITTGEGGAIVSADAGLLEDARSRRSHGARAAEGAWVFTAPGFNYRMTEMAAALGVGQLLRLEDILRRKAKRVADYRAALREVEGVALPPPFEGGRETHQSLVVTLDEGLDRDRVIARMRDRGIETTIGTYALHRQPLFQTRYGYRNGQLPVSDWAFRQALTLPLYAAMSSGDVARVCEALSGAIAPRGSGE